MNINRSISQGLFILASLPKTIIFNIRTFDLRTAIKLPVLVGYNVRVLETHHGAMEFQLTGNRGIQPFMVRFGYGGPRGVVAYPYSELCLEKTGKAVFRGTAFFGRGSSLRVSGLLYVGNHLSTSKNSFISCTANGSTFGENVMFGWGVSVRDSDGHTIYKDGEPKLSVKPFHIGNHVWLCAEAHVLKGVEIADDSIVAYRSTVLKSFVEKGSLVGGSPAKLLQTGISWGMYNKELEIQKNII